MIRELTCISCPVGCTLRVKLNENGLIKVEGNYCPHGEAYAKEEITAPQRVLSTSVKVVGGDYPLVSVRTDRPIPKHLIPEALKQIRGLVLTAPVQISQVLVANFLGTGANLIATRAVRRAAPSETPEAYTFRAERERRQEQ